MKYSALRLLSVVTLASSSVEAFSFFPKEGVHPGSTCTPRSSITGLKKNHHHRQRTVERDVASFIFASQLFIAPLIANAVSGGLLVVAMLKLVCLLECACISTKAFWTVYECTLCANLVAAPASSFRWLAGMVPP